MSQTLASVLIAVVLALIDVLADACIKKAGLGQNMDVKWFVLGFVLYATTVWGWFYVLKSLKLASVGVVYGVSCVLFLAIAGAFFGERLKAGEVVGVVMAISSIVLLSRFA